jgi:hypothetical protein
MAEDNSAFMPRPMNRRRKEVTGRNAPAPAAPEPITQTTIVSAATPIKQPPALPDDENVFAQLKRTSKKGNANEQE